MKYDFYNRASIEKKVKKNYSKVSWFYDLWADLTESKANEKVLEFSAINNGESILEVAVGTGRMFREIVKLNPDGWCEGVELSPDMKKIAEKQLPVLNNNFNIIQGSAYELPYENSSFDLLINDFMIELLPENDFEIILNEFSRVLKPTGRMVISTMTYAEKWYGKIWEFIAEEFPALLTGCRPVNISRELKKCGFDVAEESFISQNTFPTIVMRAEKKR